MSLLMNACEKISSSLLMRWVTATDQRMTVINVSLIKSRLIVVITQIIEKLSNQLFDIMAIMGKPQLIEKVLPTCHHCLIHSSRLIANAAGYSPPLRENVMGNQTMISVISNCSKR